MILSASEQTGTGSPLWENRNGSARTSRLLIVRKGFFRCWSLVVGISFVTSALSFVPVSARTHPLPPVGTKLSLDTTLPSFFPFFVRPRADHSLGPVFTATSVLAYDLDAHEALYAKNVTDRLPIASLTKLMTMAIAIESKLDPDTEVPVPLSTTELEPAKLYLLARDALSVRELIFAGLIASANDAAVTLATILPDFVAAMNRKAMELRLLDTHFANPTGLDDRENYSTAVDVARLFEYALTHPLIAEAARTRHKTVTSALGKTYELDNTNILLTTDLDVVAGKTGTTDEAGQCLVNIARLRNGHRILTVILGSQARFLETQALLRWIEEGSGPPYHRE